MMYSLTYINHGIAKHFSKAMVPLSWKAGKQTARKGDFAAKRSLPAPSALRPVLEVQPLRFDQREYYRLRPDAEIALFN
jgi:hypothetical protein